MSDLKGSIAHISSTPGSFALVRSTDRWPLPTSLGSLHSSRSGEQQSRVEKEYRPIHIAVLDSSFNPPTKAHQAIAFSSFPDPHSLSSSASSSDNNQCQSPKYSKKEGSSQSAYAPPEYNARLVLFSARNVEKTLDPAHATPEQRVEMMSLLRQSSPSSLGPTSVSPENTFDHTGENAGADAHDAWGVGLINEPTFVGKAAIIRSYLSSLSHLEAERVDLTFLIGTDTLVRFFDPRFYPPGEMDSKIRHFFAPVPEGSGAYLVSARRGRTETDRALEEEVLNRDGVRQWVEQGKLRLLGSGEEGWEEVSSTRVRKAVKDGDWEEVRELAGDAVTGYIREQGLYTS